MQIPQPVPTRFADIPPTWLRDRAESLRGAARKAEVAYTGERQAICARVADAYRRAAVVLDDEATKMEDEARLR